MTECEEYDPYYGLPIFNYRDLDFNYIKSLYFVRYRNRLEGSKDSVLHFYTQDYRFNSIWTFPSRYVSMFKSFYSIISPDFSIYENFPYPVQLYNLYRIRMIDCYYINRGVKVIPNISFSSKLLDCFLFGIDVNTVSVRGTSINSDSYVLRLYSIALELMYNKGINNIIVYGRLPEDLINKFQSINFLFVNDKYNPVAVWVVFYFMAATGLYFLICLYLFFNI